MGNYYIRENGIWLGPMSLTEFEFRKSNTEKLLYWHPDYCPNKVLHPQLCSHTKTWVKPIEENHAQEDSGRVHHKQVILDARPLDPDEPDSDPDSERVKKGKTSRVPDQFDRSGDEKSLKYKLSIIIIGFLLVLLAGFYVNSKLSIMFYQDLIIQESVKDIEYVTQNMIMETMEIQEDIDSLNAVMGREFKAIRQEISDIRESLKKAQ